MDGKPGRSVLVNNGAYFQSANTWIPVPQAAYAAAPLVA